MNTDRIEELLEVLISKQDELIDRIEGVEQSLQFELSSANDQLLEISHSAKSIHDELDWWTEGHHSFAKCVLEELRRN